MTPDLMTPYELQEKMLLMSAQVDTCIAEYRTRSIDWVEKRRDARIAVNTALLTATGNNAQERKARAESGSENLIYAEEMAEALRASALEALRARREQLNALNALAYTVREELKLAR
jgi:hypothetical protein